MKQEGGGAIVLHPLGSYSGKSETNLGKFENIQVNLINNFLQTAMMRETTMLYY